MKALYCITFLFFITNSHAQFQKNEKLSGGNLDILTIKEKNEDSAPGGPFGNTSAKETDIYVRPEFSYIVSKNTGISIFGGIFSEKYSTDPGVSESKTKGYSIGAGLTRYQFFTKGFGIFRKFNASYSPAWSRFYDTTATIYPKNKFYLTDISLLPGLFYRFSKHFSLQAIIGRISYDYLVSKTEGVDNSKKHYQFSAGFSNVSFGAFYVFKYLS